MTRNSQGVWKALNAYAIGRASEMTRSPAYASAVIPCFRTSPSYLTSTVPYDVVKSCEIPFVGSNWHDPLMDPIRRIHGDLVDDWQRATPVMVAGPVTMLAWHDGFSDENGLTVVVSDEGSHEFSWYKSRSAITSYHHDGSQGTLEDYVRLMARLDAGKILENTLHGWR